MKKIYLLFTAVLLYTGSYAQEDPKAAPAIKTFALQNDVVGVASNSVNLFTGDVALPLTLISLPGRNGLNVNVSVSYNSNVQNVVGVWNMEAPTGILGLGWMMDVPKIVADHKQTGTREDDDYYLVEGGVTNRLVRTTSGSDASGSFYAYEAKTYQFWKIKFYYDIAELYNSTSYGSGPNKWEITKEDGTKLVYGDKNSGRGTVQWAVRWANWIGNSSQTAGQGQLAVAWNLAEIANVWGDKVTFEYLNQERAVGAGGKLHTEASYLKQITDMFGRKVVFNYQDKATFGSGNQFYAEPHTEQAEPDAYQENYERNYLDYVDVLREDGSKFLTVQFGYGVLDGGTNAAKMLLTSLVQKNAAGQALPGMQFSYNTAGTIKGFLRTVTYPTAGTITYDYKTSGNAIGHSERRLVVNAPPADATNPNGYGEPRVWQGEDYAVVAWRALGASGTHDGNPRDVKLFVYQWVGKWKEQFLQTIGNVSLFDYNATFKEYKDFQVVLQKRFFAVLSPGVNGYYHLFIRYKDEANRGQWLNHTTTKEYGPGLPTLTAGDNFVFAGSFRDEGTSSSYRYVLQGNSWREDVLNQTLGDHYYTGTNNYFISHNRAGFDGNPEMNFTYLTEDRKWVTKNWPYTSLLFSSSARSFWHGSNGYAVAMAAGHPEFIYRWDVTYTNFFRDNNILGTWADDSYVFNLNNSMIGIVQRGSPSKGRAARYDGQAWRTTADISAYYQHRFSYGDDFAIWTVDDRTRPVGGYLRTYNPNTMAWADRDLTYTPNTTLFGNTYGHNPLKAGINFFVFSDKGYFRNTGGSWNPDHALSTPAGTELQASSFRIGSEKYFIYRNSTSTILQFIKNGAIGASSTGISGNYYYGMGNGGPIVDLMTPNSVVTFSGVLNDARSITLQQVLLDAVSGTQLDYPVSLITTYDGSQSRYLTLDYNFATAAVDPTGTIANYNEVTTIPGSNVATSKPYGSTKTFFYNGLTSTELVVNYFPVDFRWTGMPYETRVFDNNNTLLSWNKTTYTTTVRDIKNGDGTKVESGYYTRATQTNNFIDGVETVVTQSFDANTGLPTQSISYDYDSRRGNGTTGTNYTITRYKYFWEQYDPTRAMNILSPVIQTKQSVVNNNSAGEVVVGVSATTWKNWNTVFSPHKSYAWRRTGTADFNFTTWSDAGEPAADWIKVSQVDALDAKGNPLQVSIR
jgi:hypothetical protein